MKELKVRLTFTEEVLGTSSSNPDIHREFIASKAPDAPSMKEEVEAIGIQAVEDRAKTIFPKDENGNPHLWDYQIKGFFKNAAKAGYQAGGDMKLLAYKSKIDNGLFVDPRVIKFELPKDGSVGDCQRPLRAQTAQGERIALANSETVPAGTQIEFTIMCYDEKLYKWVKMHWLNYGKLNGIGQWHNSGKGRFTWEEI